MGLNPWVGRKMRKGGHTESARWRNIYLPLESHDCHRNQVLSLRKHPHDGLACWSHVMTIGTRMGHNLENLVRRTTVNEANAPKHPNTSNKYTVLYTYEDISDMQYTIKYIQKRIMIYRIDMQPKSGSSHYKIGASVIDTTPALVRCRHGLPAMWHFHWECPGWCRFQPISTWAVCQPWHGWDVQGMLKFSTFTMHGWYMVVVKSQKASFDALFLRGCSSSEDSMISISK